MFVFAGLPRVLPAGYGCAPVAEQSGPVRVCVVVRAGDKKGGDSKPFVVLRETLDAKVFLGCLLDAAGRVQEWLEIWVQDLSGLSNALTAYRGVLTNKMLDERWVARCEAFSTLEGGLISTGWESVNPPLSFIDLKKLDVIGAKDRKSGAVWSLCQDEALLASKGVPGYAATLSRHLYQPELGGETAFLPLDVIGADPAAMGVGAPGEAAALNGGGGLMMVRRYCPLSYEQFVDAITGVDGEAGPGDALLSNIAATAVALPAGGKAVGEARTSNGWLMLGAMGSSGRLVEALHLKLMVFAQAVAAVRAATSAGQMPMLNVAAHSFRIRLGEGAGTVPLWWTAQTELVEPGEGIELPIEGTQAKYYLAGRGGGLTIYAPAGIGRTTQGKGWLRLRNVVADAGGTILEGTLSTQERIVPGRNDLLWLRFAVGATRVDLYATVDAQGAMGAGEIRIRTIPQRLNEGVVAQINSALGVPIPEVNFEMVPLLSTPCDLYALGVLAVRTLLVGGKRALPVALDELLSLAFQASKQAESGEDLATRLMTVFESDKRWAAALGPQALVVEAADANEAFVAIPPRLWFSTLAMVIRMFTGLSADSSCRDYGDAPGGGVHKVFDGVLDELYALLTACRSLIVSDYSLNAEVRGVVQECLAGAKG